MLGSFIIRLIISSLLCSVIPVIIVGFVGYGTALNIAKDRILESVSVSHSQLRQNLDSIFGKMENVCDSTENYLYVLMNKPLEPLSEYLDYFTNARQSITILTDIFDLYNTCVFLPANMFVSNEGLTFFSIPDLKKYKINRELLTGIGISSQWLYREDLQFPIIIARDLNPVNALLCFRAYCVGTEIKYALFSCILTDTIGDQFRNFFSGVPITNYLVNQEGIIVAHTDPSMEGGSFPEKKLKTITFSNKAAIYLGANPIFADQFDNGLYLISEIPYSYLTEQALRLLRFTVIILVIMVPFTIYITFMVSKTLTKKLKILSGSVKSLQLFDNTITVKDIAHYFNLNSPYKDEFDSLAEAYTNMITVIQKNIDNILSLTLREERLRYQVLQSQINPHFLYNILGSIHTCYSLGEKDTADQMINALTRFYRLLLRKDRDLIPLKEELEIAGLYLQIESLCRKGVLTWEMNYEDGIEHFKIGKFTLQPILENSLLHGFVNPREKMHITVDCRYGEDTVIIIISDDGIGIDPSYLALLQENLKNRHPHDFDRHIGLYNVNARISNPLYGSGNITIESKAGKGTKVIIEFKQILTEDEHEECFNS
ncbi:MAG: histidine kinase [Spirochaetaceae bacterium]|jgi:two-component system sensor histidine kinase YesM|nr:histidine kinase [Spirochaetaceae bacterium]